MIQFSPDVLRQVNRLITPARFNVLVRLFHTPEKLASGIYLSQKSQSDVNVSECRAQVWAMAPDCFTGREWPSGNSIGVEQGDWVLIASYAGGQVEMAEAFPGEEFRLIADTEILARISSPDEVNRKW
jgi:co-chaperonin GroES (HSP10)